jgi:hypothetical protein
VLLHQQKPYARQHRESGAIFRRERSSGIHQAGEAQIPSAAYVMLIKHRKQPSSFTATAMERGAEV